jgi:hypothetical protein
MIRIVKGCSLALAELETPAELARQLRRADDFIRLAVVGGYHVIREVPENRNISDDRRGLFLGTAFGTMETNFEVLDQIISGEQTSPILFSHSVFNAAAGYMASVFSLRGCSLTVTDFSMPFFRALEQGMLAITSGMLDSCLVLQVESYSALLDDAGKRMDPHYRSWSPGVICWLLAHDTFGAGRILEKLSIESDMFGETGMFSEHYGEMVLNGKKYECSNPLAAGRNLTEEMIKGGTVSLDCHIRTTSATVQCIIR